MPQAEQIISLIHTYIPQATAQETSQLILYMDLLLEYNAKFNLTAITEHQDIIIKHFADSLLGLSLIPPHSSIIDVGSGAGFPAIPLKIMQKELKITMLDSVGKKVSFLNVIIDALGLTDACALKIRAEEAARTSHREKYDVAVARAVSNLNMLLELTSPFIKVGGLLIAYKGSDAPNEIQEARGAIHKLGLTLVEQKDVILAEKYNRTLLVFKKTTKTNAIYPRIYSKMKTNPL